MQENIKVKQQKKHFKLETKDLILQPYRRSYVQQYHEWFTKYPQILHLTGSQPLTLQQQIQNHKSWLEDPKKYTFIIFTKQDHRMIGDVNLFFSDWIQPNQAQINIMIAVKEYRGRGLSKQVMEVIQLFSQGYYNKNTIIAKIKKENIPSIKFFQKIGYIFIQDLHHYDEKQYHKKITIPKQQALLDLQQKYKIQQILDASSLYNN